MYVHESYPLLLVTFLWLYYLGRTGQICSSLIAWMMRGLFNMVHPTFRMKQQMEVLELHIRLLAKTCA